MFFVFRDSYVLCIYVMNILCTFRISISGYGTGLAKWISRWLVVQWGTRDLVTSMLVSEFSKTKLRGGMASPRLWSRNERIRIPFAIFRSFSVEYKCEIYGTTWYRLNSITAMNDRETWRERVRDIRASCTSWWWSSSFYKQRLGIK